MQDTEAYKLQEIILKAYFAGKTKYMKVNLESCSKGWNDDV